MPARGPKNGEVEKELVEEFAESHGLITNVEEINKAVISLPKDSSKRGRESPRTGAVRKAFYLDLFDQTGHQLLSEFYRLHCKGSEGYERSEWREFYDDSRVRYEGRLAELPDANQKAYKALRLKFSVPHSQSPKSPPLAAENVQPPTRTATMVSRIDRDSFSPDRLKQEYEFRCQICKTALPYGDGLSCIQVHHLWPLGEPHNGLDTTSNMMVLCPNHHALFDRGVPRFVNNQTVEIYGTAYELTLRHEIAKECIEYYIRTIFKQVS